MERVVEFRPRLYFAYDRLQIDPFPIDDIELGCAAWMNFNKGLSYRATQARDVTMLLINELKVSKRGQDERKLARQF